MKMQTGAASVGIAWIVIAVLFSCSGRANRRLAELLALESTEGTASPSPSDERIRELQASIAQYREIVEMQVESAGSLAHYYKLLALEYISRNMWGLALDSLREAFIIEPENGSLFYLSGVSAARSAKGMIGDAVGQADLYADAEAYYLRSVELDPDYEEALYGLSVLYLYEVSLPDRARPYLDRLLMLDENDMRARMLSAHLFALEGNRVEADSLYAEIEEQAEDREIRDAARENRQGLMGDAP